MDGSQIKSTSSVETRKDDFANGVFKVVFANWCLRPIINKTLIKKKKARVGES